MGRSFNLGRTYCRSNYPGQIGFRQFTAIIFACKQKIAVARMLGAMGFPKVYVVNSEVYAQAGLACSVLKLLLLAGLFN